MRHLSKTQIEALPERELAAIIRTTNRYGRFAQQLVWAKQEADRRYCRIMGLPERYVAEGLGETIDFCPSDLDRGL